MTQRATALEPRAKVSQLTLSKETLRQMAGDETGGTGEARNPHSVNTRCNVFSCGHRCF